MARALALWALLSTLVISTLGAQMWSVEIVALSEEANGILDLVLGQGETYAPLLVVDQPRRDHLQQKEATNRRGEWEAEVLGMWSEHTRPAEFSMPIQVHEPSSIVDSITYAKVPYDATRAAMLSFSEEAIAWYRQRQGLDAVILVDVQPIDRFERVLITAFETTSKTLIDRLVEARSYHPMEEELGLALLGWAGANTLSALLVEGGPAALHATMDGQVFDHRRPIIKEAGSYLIDLNSPSHQGRSVWVDLAAGQLTVLDAGLDPIPAPPLSIISKSGEVNWFVQGSAAGSSHALEVIDPSYPLSIMATKEGFTEQMINLQGPPVKGLSIEMIGRPALSASLMDGQQRAFYKQLRNTILFFGAYVATIALSQTPGLESQGWQAAQITTSALALINAIALGGQLASYGQAYGL